MTKRRPILRAKGYPAIQQAVAMGVRSGMRQFWKHRDDAPPDETQANLADEIMSAVTSELYVWFRVEADEQREDS